MVIKYAYGARFRIYVMVNKQHRPMCSKHGTFVTKATCCMPSICSQQRQKLKANKRGAKARSHAFVRALCYREIPFYELLGFPLLIRSCHSLSSKLRQHQPLPDPHPAPIDSWGFPTTTRSPPYQTWSIISHQRKTFTSISCDIIFGVFHAEQRRISAEGLAAPDARIESWNSKHTLTNPPISLHW